MSLPFELFLAMRYLRSKRKEVFISIITVISVLGVAISVMVLNIVLAVMTGFEEELQAKLIDANAHIVIRRMGGDMADSERMVEKLSGVEGIASVYPYTYSQALLQTEGGARGILIRGVADSSTPREKLAAVLEENVSIDALFSPTKVEVIRPEGQSEQVGLPSLIVGKELQRRLGILPLSPVTVLSPDFQASPMGLMPKHRRFGVAGFYQSGLVEYESGLAYASMKEAQSFFGMNDKVTGIEISVYDRNQTAAVSARIAEVLSLESEQYYISDWTEQNKPLWDAIRLEKRVYFIVLLLLILIASFSIVSTLVMVVMEKSKDIAILKSMGARDSSILSIFIVQGACIGFVGVIVGTLLGYLGCIALREYGFPIDARVFSLDTVPVRLEAQNFVIVSAAGFLITSLAGIYPALRGARIRPADALRFD